MPFYKKKQTVFKTTKLDIAVFLIVTCIFVWAFFFDSFRPLIDDEGNVTYYIDRNGCRQVVRTINLQVIIAPLIMTYEMVVLVLLNGKTRGRYLPWDLYYRLFCYKVKQKIKDGVNEYHEWKKHK